LKTIDSLSNFIHLPLYELAPYNTTYQERSAS